MDLANLDISDLYLDKHLLFQFNRAYCNLTEPIAILHIEEFIYLLYLDGDFYTRDNLAVEFNNWIADLNSKTKKWRDRYLYIIDFENQETYTEFVLRFMPHKL